MYNFIIWQSPHACDVRSITKISHRPTSRSLRPSVSSSVVKCTLLHFGLVNTPSPLHFFFFWFIYFHWWSKIWISLGIIHIYILYPCWSYFFPKDFNNFLYEEHTEALSYNFYPPHRIRAPPKHEVIYTTHIRRKNTRNPRNKTRPRPVEQDTASNSEQLFSNSNIEVSTVHLTDVLCG
jgi:hypothetical protein